METQHYRSSKRDKYLEGVLLDNASGLTKAAIAKKYGISIRVVFKWIANFASNYKFKGNEVMKEQTPQEPKSINREDMANLTPEEQIAYLKEALRKAELRADAYDTMIDIAESKFGISIRKKAGVKQ